MGKSKAWPAKGTVNFEDMTGPVCEAIRFAYDLSRKNHNWSIPWTGYNIGARALVGGPPPHLRLRRDSLHYDEYDQGRDALEVLVGVAVQLGIEQGRRMGEESGATGRELAKMLAQQVLKTFQEDPLAAAEES